MNVEHRTSDSPKVSKHLSASGRSNNVFCPSRASGSNDRVERSIKKRLCKAKPSFEIYPPLVDLSAFGGFCDSRVLDSIKRSAINIRRSMLDVRCSTFNLFAVPLLGEVGDYLGIRRASCTLCGSSTEIK
jgi:hypothetical protein